MRGLTYTVKLERCKQHGKNARPKDCAVCKELIVENKQTEDRTHDRNRLRVRARSHTPEPAAPAPRKRPKRTRARKQRTTAAAEASS